MIFQRQDNRNWGYGFRRERNLWWGGHERLHWGEKMVEKENLNQLRKSNMLEGIIPIVLVWKLRLRSIREQAQGYTRTN